MIRLTVFVPLWDLGYNDATAIIFYQNVGHAINIIDFLRKQYNQVVSTLCSDTQRKRL